MRYSGQSRDCLHRQRQATAAGWAWAWTWRTKYLAKLAPSLSGTASGHTAWSVSVPGPRPIRRHPMCATLSIGSVSRCDRSLPIRTKRPTCPREPCEADRPAGLRPVREDARRPGSRWSALAYGSQISADFVLATMRTTVQAAATEQHG